MNETLKILNALIAALGEAATLGQAKSWLEVEANATELLKEGHENDAKPE